MDIRSLRLFSHLARSLHFGRTSESLHVSAPTLSRVIQRLEEEVGEPLLMRDNRTVALTPAGESYLRFAERVLDDWQQLSQELSVDSSALTGRISLYCTVTAAYSYLRQLLVPFRQRYPQIDIDLQTGDAAFAVEKVREGEADLAITGIPDKLPTHVIVHMLADAPLVLIAPTLSCPVRTAVLQDPIDWAQLPIILAERGLSRERLLGWLKRKQVKPNIHSEVSGHEAIVSMVALGFGVGVVPAPVLAHSPLREEVVELPVTPTFEPFRVGLCADDRRLKDPRLAAFWRLAVG
ncbi:MULTISPECIES: HTH-type transcriptional activator IlvY [Corallincola]|uniref:HTH-type transcriptional activator IlvY n=3 Tax=Corallincola TaxID=1775176 RepID=A0A368N7D7_9GAMM|nr:MULTISPECIES: HTH-type transcriptional activator IlvY [Corallincola]RCU45444.1 HTH-type transcriptional activator IlvY [Corallincola holothuriorum]TAA41045.1 HTH-type transcriptional activator IlvY [Corallincola spongiicola]TCI02695.1 HTH-type transcriptional activator IlvY [Corallincola luteus]